jgi:uncharacterized protein with FMN-binding domain
VRTPNKVIVGLMGVGVLAAAYKTGLTTADAAANGLDAPLTPITDGHTPAPTNNPDATANPTTDPNSGGTKTPTKPSSNGGTSGGTTDPVTPVEPVTPPVEPVPGPAAGNTQTGAAIGYRFGTIQLSVTKSNGSITAIDLVQAGATGGRQGAFPSLVSAAIAANGSTFGNVSRATYTTDAFKQALDSALAKF